MFSERFLKLLPPNFRNFVKETVKNADRLARENPQGTMNVVEEVLEGANKALKKDNLEKENKNKKVPTETDS